MYASLLIGVIVGLATGLWMWTEFALGLHTASTDIGRFTGFLSIVFPIAGLVMSLRRSRARDGQLTFRSGVPHVLAVCVGAAAASVPMSTIYIMWLNSSWLSKVGMTAGEFVAQGAVAALVGGVFVGMIVLAFLRTRPSKVAMP